MLTLQDGKEVCYVFGVCVFYSEVVYHEAELDGSGCMFPEAECDWAFGVSVGFEDLDELVIGNFSGLGQTVHALLYLNVYMAVVDERL
mmetsp:Transcript_31421/g.44594  ORF Transcript_31421/g.44594 Transcript_31421/m.44594 type:complete len:88 (+) Transcript_31421:24-287(+)